MKISIFTPTHDTKYLLAAYNSLIEQTHADWEWVVMLNGGAKLDNGYATDGRVRVIRAFPEWDGNIGALKKAACNGCTGDVLLELDHDDMLTPDALAKVAEAFDKNPSVGFVYSDSVRFTTDKSRPTHFDAAYGWPEQQRLTWNGLDGWYQPSFDPSSQALARIWYAPDHLRAWRRGKYWEIGGHNPEYPVCDDYELLLRTYLHTDFVHIREPLYWYRLTGQNTSHENATIQELQFQLGNEYRTRIAETWARRQRLALIDLCSGPEPAEGYIGFDKHFGQLGNDDGMPGQPGQVFKADLRDRWPVYDNEVGVLRAQDALEHLPDTLHTMQEAHRALAHGGWFFSDTPSTDGRGAWQDPTHVSYWNSNSFWYYTSAVHRSYAPGAPHFQMWHVDNIFYSDWYKLHNIPYVRAHMSAVKDGVRLPGPYDFTP